MTIYIADIASYQGTLTPSALLSAGFTGVNVKISDGLSQKSVHSSAAQWLADARFTRSTFHYLRPGISGVDQAGYAYARLCEVTTVQNALAHVVDVEADGITEDIFRDYVSTMALLLGRGIALYTGDWYAASRPWVRTSTYCPWLWAAPNVGYLSKYPGDTSDDWYTGYAATTALSVMQYAVAPVAGIDVSMSAVRTAATWDAMRGIGVAWQITAGLGNLRAQVDRRFPHRDYASDGTIGDAAHQASTSSHNPDDTPGSTPEWDGDSDKVAEVRAWDMDSDLGEPGTTAQMVVDHLRALPNLSSVLRYMIYNRKIYTASAGWAPTDYTGASAHTEHIHFTGAYSDAADDNTTFDYRLDQLGVSDVELSDKTGNKGYPNRTVGQQLNDLWGVRDAFWGDKTGTAAVPVPAGSPLAKLIALPDAVAAMNKSLSAAISALAAKDQVDEAALAQQLIPGVVAGVIAALPTTTDAVSQDEVTTAVTEAFRAAFGTR